MQGIQQLVVLVTRLIAWVPPEPCWLSPGTGDAGALPAACCGAAPGPCGGAEEPFPPADTAGGPGAAGRATDACRSRNRRGRLGRGSDPRVRICQRQRRDQRARAAAPAGAVGSDTPALAGSQATGTWLGNPRRAAKRGDEGGMPAAMPIPHGDRHRASGQCLRGWPGTPLGREGVAGGRRGASLPLRFFPGWKPGPPDA